MILVIISVREFTLMIIQLNISIKSTSGHIIHLLYTTGFSDSDILWFMESKTPVIGMQQLISLFNVDLSFGVMTQSLQYHVILSIKPTLSFLASETYRIVPYANE